MEQRSNSRLAVLILTYNAGRFIQQALKSVIDAGADDRIDALYVADDASSDDTVEIVRSAWRSKTPLRILEAERNQGEYRNLNRAMQAVERDGIEWVLLLHHDDLLQGDWVRVAADLISRSAADVSIICCRNSYEDLDSRNGAQASEGELVRLRDVEYEIHPGGEDSIRRLRHQWFWTISGSALRVRAFNALGGFHPGMTYYGEADFLCRFFAGGYSALHVRGLGVLKRHHGANVTSSNTRWGTDAIAWSYLMQRYLRYTTKPDRSSEFAWHLYIVARRALSFLKRKDWRAATAQCVAARILLQSWAALLLNLPPLFPAVVRTLLAHEFRPVGLGPEGLSPPRS